MTASKSKRMGWASFRGDYLPPIPAGASQWELLLHRMGLDEDKAIKLLENKRKQDAKIIADWVRDHYTRTFVPLMVLRLLGMETFE